jgi:putative restriction endonuclease
MRCGNRETVKVYVGVTDTAWFAYLQNRSSEEANFWRPSGKAFKVLRPGDLFLFKSRAPHNRIVGGGYFVDAPKLPLISAWEIFGEGNGVPTLQALQERIATYRKEPWTLAYNPNITCITLSEVFYFDEVSTFEAPGFAKNIVSGKSYGSGDPNNTTLLQETIARLAVHPSPLLNAQQNQAVQNLILSAGRGKPTSILPRLGQGAFRALVMKAYGQACSITNDHTLPVLEAAHVKPFSLTQTHSVDNGLLLRSDLHKLFDQGFITLKPEDRTLVVSRKLKDVYQNGRIYYALEGRSLRVPAPGYPTVSEENLRFHAEKVFMP